MDLSTRSHMLRTLGATEEHVARVQEANRARLMDGHA